MTSSWSPGPAWLFCPADRPDRFARALAESDVAIFDLEDAVALESKAEARQALLDSLKGVSPDRFIVRVSAASSDQHADDVETLERLGRVRVMLAKCDGPADVASLSDYETVCLIESPAGLVRSFEIASMPQVIGLMWGADDLVAAAGGTASRRSDGHYRDLPRFARATVLASAKAAQKLAVDNVVMALDDDSLIETEVEDAVASGFDAKAAIHPRQLSVIRRGYLPSAAQTAWAAEIVEAASASTGVFRLNGRMVDGPIVAQAKRILAYAARHDPSQ